MGIGPGGLLITQAQMGRFAGSEMVTLELIEHFADQGVPVTLWTHIVAEPMASELAAVPGLEILLTSDPESEDRIAEGTYGLVWIHHQLIPRAVARGEIDAPVVFHHMSSILPIEAPVVPGVESTVGSRSLFFSPHVLVSFRDRGLLREYDPERLAVFPNPAPEGFVALPSPLRAGTPRLALVSNHVPAELREALELTAGTIEIQAIGEQRRFGARPERLSPRVLEQFDGVITIGKTVQYALVSGRAVYCYDHFGGPGWLTDGVC